MAAYNKRICRHGAWLGNAEQVDRCRLITAADVINVEATATMTV
jgi:hypothetical protein